MMNNVKQMSVVCFLCSILDESTKIQRAITYDSPAATKKVFDVCHALQNRIKNVYVLTMARGQQQGKRRSFAAKVQFTSGLPVLSAQYNPLPLWTYFSSAFSLIFLMWRVMTQHKSSTLHLLVYNRNWLYVPCIVLARLFGAKCYLDLEDGALVETSGLWSRFKYYGLKFVFDNLCDSGSILVAPGLRSQVNTANNVICYGVAKCSEQIVVNKWSGDVVKFLLGGTLMRETGASLLIDAVRILNSDFQHYKGSLIISVTGHGPLAADLAQFAQIEGNGWIDFLGRVSQAEYAEVLRSVQVGLCLKLPSCEMGTTTFPSKVIEIAAQGKLVLTTKLGHVSDLFGPDGAVYLEDETPLTLALALVRVVADRVAASSAAVVGHQHVVKMCSPEKVAGDICSLFANALIK